MVVRSTVSRTVNTSVRSTLGSGGGAGTSVPRLLNTYTGGAAAFGLRLLRNGYSGSCVRVRNSDSDELDIGFSSGVLNSSALLSFCGSGDGWVTAWYDQSGNSRNLTQPTTTLQPQIVSSGAVIEQGGKPTIRFNNHWMQTSGFSNSLQDVTLYAIAGESVTVNFAGLVSFHAGAGNDFNRIDSFAVNADDDTGTAVTNGGTPNTLLLKKTGSGLTAFKDYWFMKTATTSQLRCDGSQAATDNSFTAFSTSVAEQKILVGGRFLSGDVSSLYRLNGWISEIVYWPIDYTSQVTEMETAVNDYWGLHA